MGVNIGGGGEVAVTQPFLNLLHGNAVCQKKAGATMTQVMKADRTQTVFLQQLRELLGNIVGADDVPDLVHTQIAEISIASVARRLGHSSMTTTQKTYLHIIQELENQDIDLVMRSLSGLS